MEAVHADWKGYLNLLICEESHLKYMEDYHQVPATWAPWGGTQRPLGSLVRSAPLPQEPFGAAFPRCPVSVVLMVDTHVP